MNPIYKLLAADAECATVDSVAKTVVVIEQPHRLPYLGFRLHIMTLNEFGLLALGQLPTTAQAWWTIVNHHISPTRLKDSSTYRV